MHTPCTIDKAAAQIVIIDDYYRDRRFSVDDDDGSLPEGRFIGSYATRDEMSEVTEVVSRCLPHRQ